MPRNTSVDTLDRIIRSLQQQRQEHADAVAQIDETLAKYGIRLGEPGRPGRRAAAVLPPVPAPKGTRRRKRRSFEQTADQYIIGLLEKKPMSTSELNNAWKSTGRGGKPDNTLGKLVKDKKIKREKIEGGQGSTYSLA